MTGHRTTPPTPSTSGGETVGSSRRLLLLALNACVLFLLTLTLGAGNALAVTGYLPDGEFGNGTLGNVPTDIAVDDATGHVLVADSTNNRIVVFESGEPGAGVLTTFGGGELSAPYGIAINEATGVVYVSDAGNDRIVRYTSDGAPTPTYTRDLAYTSPTHGAGAAQVGDFASPLAIDPLTGDLLVADRGNLRVERYDSTGGFLKSFDGSTAPSGAFTSLREIAAGPNGTIYLIADSTEGPYGEVSGSVVETFAAGGSFEETMRGPNGNPGELSTARALAYDTRVDNVLLATGGNYFEGGIVLHFLHGGQQIGQVGLPASQEYTLAVAIAVPSAQLAPVSMLTAPTVAFGIGVAGVLGVKGVSVDFTLSPVSEITGTSAHLEGTVNPHGDSGSTHFEHRLVDTEGWTIDPEQTVSAGNAAQPVEEDLAALLPNEAYEVRLAASVSGLTLVSSVAQFRTVAIVPAVVTQQATGVSGSAATLNGTVNPNDEVGTWFFEYGATAAYGARIPISVAAPAGAGHMPVSFSRTIGGLTQGDTYHFRIVAENATGIARGLDRTFVAAAPQVRAYEAVTPVDQVGAYPAQNGGVFALSGAAGIAYGTSPVGSGSDSAPLQAWRLSLRGESDWGTPINLDPKVSNPPIGRLWKATLGVSADGTHTLVVTNERLTPDALEENAAANLYVEDLRNSSMRLVAAVPGALQFFIVTATAPEHVIAGAEDFSWVVLYSGVPLLPGVTHAALYRWSSAGLEVFSTLPDGSAPSASVEPLGNSYVTRHPVSADGSALLFNPEEGPAYVRHGNVTVAVSVSKLDGEPKPAEAVAIDTTGRYAYFVSGAPLISGATKNGLYRYDSQTNNLEYVSALSAEGSLLAEDALAVSADGSSVAFDAEGSGGLQLMVWDEGKVRTLAPGYYQAFKWLQFSANGQYLAYQNVAGDVYLYDVRNDELVCASCRAGQPTGDASLPPEPFGERAMGNRLPQVVDDQGQVFFNSNTALTAADTNGEEDVYMFQGGQVSLISPGDGPYPAALMDISPEGQDVYFTTAQPLVARDTNRAPDIYDARVGGGFAAQNEAPAPSCDGEACQGAWQGAPAVGALGSEVLTGAGPAPRAVSPAPKRKVAKPKVPRKQCKTVHSKHGSQKKLRCKSATGKRTAKAVHGARRVKEAGR